MANDIASLLGSPSFMDQAYQDAYSKQMNDNLVQQKVAELRQQALQNAQMLPLNMANKQASTDFLGAEGRMMNANADFIPAQKQSLINQQQEKTNQLVAQAKGRQAIGVLSGIKQAYDMPGFDPNGAIDNLFASNMIPESAKPFLKPSAGVSNYTKDAIDSAINHISALDPELAKTSRIGMQQEGANTRQASTNASRERVAEIHDVLRKEIEAAKAAGKTPSESQVMGSLLSKVANGTISPEELKALDVAQLMRAAAQTAPPGIAAIPKPGGGIEVVGKQQTPSSILGGGKSNKETLKQLLGQ